MPASGGEIYEVLGVYTANPLTTTKFAPVPWEETDNGVSVQTTLESVWCEYLVTPTVLRDVAAADLEETEIPERFASILAYRAAANLLLADGAESQAAALMALAERAYQDEVSRLRTPRRWLVARGA